MENKIKSKEEAAKEMVVILKYPGMEVTSVVQILEKI